MSEEKPLSDDELLAKALPIDAIEDLDEPDLIAEELSSPEPVKDDGKKEDVERSAPIELTADEHTHRKIAAFDHKRERLDEWKRPVNKTGDGATHVRTFVSKLRLEAIDHLDEQVNHWLDEHPDFEVKFVTAAIGPLVGKLREDALFMSVWV